MALHFDTTSTCLPAAPSRPPTPSRDQWAGTDILRHVRPHGVRVAVDVCALRPPQHAAAVGLRQCGGRLRQVRHRVQRVLVVLHPRADIRRSGCVHVLHWLQRCSPDEGVCGLAQVAILTCPTLFVALWFGDAERAVANTVASISNPVGVAVCQPHIDSLRSLPCRLPVCWRRR